MLYNSDKIGKSDNEGSSGVGSNDVYNRRAELVLVSLLCLYLLLESISVDVSRPSSCFALHYLLTTYFTNYCTALVKLYMILF